MKAIVICAGIATMVFLAMGYQSGMFSYEEDSTPVEVASQEQPKPAAPALPPANSPEDLAPAARAQPVPQAAAYNPKSEYPKFVVLKTTGILHTTWQDKVPEDWAATTVEETQLILVTGPQKKTTLNTLYYPNGAPPVTRYRYQIEIAVVEAKSGKVLCNRMFINEPRDIRPQEAWELTGIGHVVPFETVFRWFTSQARGHFPYDPNPGVITNMVE